MALSQLSEAVKIFFSLASASKDRTLFEELRKHLSGLTRQGLIEMCYDSLISAGSNFRDIIQAHISTADIIVLLISADFLDSQQCFEIEMPYALEQHATRAARVIPVLLRPAAWQGLPFEQYNPLPQNGQAVSIWDNLDSALTEVAEGIHSVVEELAHRWVGTRTPVKPPQFPLCTLALRRNPSFTNRKETLTALHRYFATGQAGQTRIQVLQGLGGMGKTLLAIEYAHLHQDEYQAILSLNAASRELLSAGALSLAAQLGILARDNVDEQQHIAAIQRWLQHHDRWLLVLDNVEDFTIVDQLIPLDSGGHVLLTTPSQATGQFANIVSIDQMTTEEGALLLLRSAKIIQAQGSRDDASEADNLQAIEIAQEVKGYPLALDQAGAYIEETGRTLASYLTLYQDRKAVLLETRGRLAKGHPASVTTTLSLIFDKIAQIDPNGLELLYFFAFLHPEALPDEMLRHGASALTGPLHTLVADPITLDTAIATLLRFSLVHRRADATTLNMHGIVQVVIRQKLTKKQQRQLANQAVRLINFTFPAVLFKTWEGCERYVLQAQACASLMRDFRLTLEEGGLLLERLGFYCYQRGRYIDANTYLTQALSLQEQQQHGDPLDMAQTLNSLGLLSQRQARYQDAEALHQRALALRERVLGPDDPETVESLHNLAVLYEHNGQYQQAEQIYLRVLSVDERTLGADHLDSVTTLNNLGLIYYLQHNYTQAEATYQRVLTIYERSSFADHPNLAYTWSGLGALAEQRGDYQRAEVLYRRALALREQALGEEHSETIHSINTLANIYESQGHYEQAEALYRRALTIGEQALGPEHPDVALFLNNLGFLMAKQGQYQQAKLLYQNALSIYKQSLNPDHPSIARIHNNLDQLARNITNEENGEEA